MTKKTNKKLKTESIESIIESDALPLIMAESNPIVTLPKQRLTVRADFIATLGSVRGNRKLNFCSIHNGTIGESMIDAPESNFYNPRNLGGKRHNSNNVAKFVDTDANALLARLMARNDVVNGYVAGTGSMRSVWVAFISENPNQ